MEKYMNIGPKQPVTMRGGDGVHRLTAFQVSSINTGVVSETVHESGSLGRVTLMLENVIHETLDADGRVISQEGSTMKIEVSGDALLQLASVLRAAFPLV